MHDAMKFRGFIFIWCCAHLLLPSAAVTNQQDVAALNALKQAWSPTSFSWAGDPCDDKWLGVTCDGSSTNVVKLILPNHALFGILPGQIGNLVNLEQLDLSFNGNLTGPLPKELFTMINLTELFLQYCGFSGTIPSELGNLRNLTYLALNHNFFTGGIPSNIGQLTQLVWLDVSSNNLNGTLPVSMGNLTNAKHFHLQTNLFSGIIPLGIFNPNMQIVHLLLNNNSFQSPIPADIGNLTHLDILRLDFNNFTDPVPQSLSELTTVTSVQLSYNSFSGALPNLSSLSNLQVLDLGHNPFNSAELPPWFLTFPNLQSLAMEEGNLIGGVPANIFSPTNLTTVTLGFNRLNGTLDLQKTGPALTLVDLRQNHISDVEVGGFTKTLMLQGTDLCNSNPNQPDNACSSTPPSPSGLLLPPSSCGCSQGFIPNPTATSGSCLCSLPVSGYIIFTALKITLDDQVTPTLESGFAKNLPVSSVQQVFISIVTNVVVNISIFPSNAPTWELSKANLITSLLSSKVIELPGVGPYEYVPFGPYSPPETTNGAGLSSGAKAGIGVGVAALAVIILIIGIYACLQKKRADKAEEISKPFASWIKTGEDKGDAPKLKGARLFTLSEIKKATNNFSKSNEIGVGGYGKVYKGILPSGELVAIKKAQASSQQGVAEFKNEIELLSRVHHKNLVGLVGFCFEEQMLVYEYMPNGTMRDCLSGRGVHMDWQQRVMLALGSARGISYLHMEANPPIIHRDIKSSNILLDEKLIAKVADFGLSKLAPDDGGTGQAHVSTQVKGTLGYLDPEYYTTQRLTDKSDVYSFGVVLLELITAKQPIEQGKFIVREVRTALQKGGLSSLQRLLDPDLTDCPSTDLKVFLEIALRSVEEEAALRPTMNEVAKELETLVQNPKAGIEKTDSGYAHKGTYTEEADYPHDVDSSFQYSGGYGMPVTIEPK